MTSRSPTLSLAFATFVTFTVGLERSAAQTPPNPLWRYTLLPDSVLIDDCGACGRPTVSLPLRGTLDLQLLEESPLFSMHAVTNVQFTAGSDSQTAYKITGHGRFEIGGEVGLRQRLTLELRLDNGFTNRPCSLTNTDLGVERLWPMIKVHVDETNQSPGQFYRLDLVTAPFRELWFSTAHGFTPGVQPLNTNHVTGGDLVSTAGRLVKRNRDLAARLGIMPMVPDLGLDAVEVLPRGEIAFSVEQDIFSESLGQLHDGDVLSDQGRVVTNYTGLIGVFRPEPPPMDQGLDALQILDTGEILFSVKQDFWSEGLSRLIRKGDLLSSRGVIVKTQEELLARFQPASPKQDYGLDAVYVWPSGEIWFSVESGFYGQHFEPYNRGDVLSDQGYLVYRNLDLLTAFQPLEDLADFGLDALFIVSDVGAPTPTTPAPQCVSIRWEQGALRMEWKALGRLFQLESATNILGPWWPVSPILTEPLNSVPSATSPLSLYRLRQW